jgi:hypothetical protein
MEGTISTEDLKAKLSRKESVKVVETLAPAARFASWPAVQFFRILAGASMIPPP